MNGREFLNLTGDEAYKVLDEMAEISTSIGFSKQLG
jgi:hypothetical protein